jgi:DNA repair exonuclease SbcCD nuclease subunit
VERVVIVAHLTDTHTNLRSRQAEAWRVLGDIVLDLRERKPDLIVHAGDLAEGPWTPAEEDQAAEWLLALADIAPVVGVAGNHDLPNRLPPRRRLAVDQLQASRHPILFVDSPKVVYVAGAAIACLPWPKEGHLLAVLGDATKDERYLAGVAALRALLLSFRLELEQHNGPRILLAHTHVRGARLGAHVPERTTFETGVEDLAGTGADYVALGHLHEHQAWTWRVDGREVPVVYAGSPFANTFGETEQKGYVLAEWREGPREVDSAVPRFKGWEFVPTTATPLAHQEYDFRGGRELVGRELVGGDHGEVAGTDVRLRYTVTDDKREAGARAAEELAARLRAEGAKSVTLEPIVEPTARARLPEIARTESIADQVAMALREQGEDEARVARCRAMVASLDHELREREAVS